MALFRAFPVSCAGDPHGPAAAPEREVDDRKGYVGRPLLELLQNAEDALAEVGCEGRVVLAKRDTVLVAANEGAPFSSRGLQSLCDRADSPKRRLPIYVGNKGTGFKAVLNWTDRPSIFSGNIAVRFDARESAQLVYESLGDAGLRGLDADGPWPRECVPLLRVPLDASPTREIQDFHADGLTTVIRLPLMADAIESVEEGLTEFDAGDLLFLRHINHIEIRVGDTTTRWSFSATPACREVVANSLVAKVSPAKGP